MTSYPVHKAKARLSEVLRLVKTRRTVIITERGVPIAKIVPFGDDDEEPLDARLARLTAQGSLQPALDPPGGSLPTRVRAKGALRRFLAERD